MSVRPSTQLHPDGAAAGDLLVFDGTQWVPAALAAGTGISIAASGSTVTVTATGGGGGGSSFPPGSADIHPGTANAHDDEFDGTSTATWAATPTAANVENVNSTRADRLYVKASGSGAAYVGVVQAIPASYPFTIRAKVSGHTARANYHRGGGIILGPASPTTSSPVFYAGTVFNGDVAWQRVLAAFDGSFTSQTGSVLKDLWSGYVKVVVNSATSIDCYASADGFAFVPIETGLNPGFTPGVMGLALSEESAGGGTETSFEFFRVT